MTRNAMIHYHAALILKARALREDGMGTPFAGFDGIRIRMYEGMMAEAASIRRKLAAS